MSDQRIPGMLYACDRKDALTRAIGGGPYLRQLVIVCRNGLWDAILSAQTWADLRVVVGRGLEHVRR